MYTSVRLQLAIILVITYFVVTRSQTTESFPLATTERPLEDENDQIVYSSRNGRGMDMNMNMDMNTDMDVMDYDHDHDHDDDHKEDHDEKKAVKEDPWAGYYDFIINEGSFKFWAVFQLVTALLLIYSAFAAVYYAKFNVITADYDYYDDFFGRSNTAPSSVNTPWLGLNSQTFQRIFNALSSKKYS